VTEPTFTRATPADIGPLADLEQKCFPHPWSRESISGELAAAGGESLVVRAPGASRPIAGLFYRIIDEEAHLFRLAVTPERRRQGIAADLMRGFIRQARTRGLRAAVLEVGAENVGALALYRRFGFSETGRRRGYYDGGREDAVMLRLNLNEEDL
jgi:ribosomal-protein-alanine N-acetyltransferase